MPAALFYHVGLSKTGSTFLQHRIFPHLQGIQYLSTRQYRQYAERVRQQPADARLLLSREFDRQMEREIKHWAAQYPDTRAILVLRRPDQWLASQYRRFTKNGFGLSLTEFLDIDQDTGYWQRDDLYFSHKIELLRQHFTQPPLVLLHDDLKRDPVGFIQRLAYELDATLDLDTLDLSPVHASYDAHQLKVMRRLGRALHIHHPRPFGASLLNTLYRYAYVYPLRYGILYGARLLPRRWTLQEDLIPPTELARIRDFYAADWQRCLDYIAMQQA